MRQPEVWGQGSITIFLIISAILVFGPLFMGPVSLPGIPLLLLFPVVLVAVLIFLVIIEQKIYTWILEMRDEVPTFSSASSLSLCYYVKMSKFLKKEFYSITLTQKHDKLRQRARKNKRSSMHENNKKLYYLLLFMDVY
ncbi:hypothetical protein VNO77_25372 [Canavalia gladiata]|uniref:Uncharacterized protein n=1 Tax=Canavalia gladiata TaxID=3824 RepID=A0AAN9L811_CANGL